MHGETVKHQYSTLWKIKTHFCGLFALASWRCILSSPLSPGVCWCRTTSAGAAYFWAWLQARTEALSSWT